MKQIKHKINIENIPEKYKSFVKPEMTNQEISMFGTIILKEKIQNIKNKLFGWYYEKKIEKNNRKKI